MERRDTLSRPTRLYFQARTRNRLYDLVMRKFRERREAEGLTQTELARRMGKRPDVLSRLLSRPSNWTIDTLSDFLLAIAGEEIDATSSFPSERPARNFSHLDRLTDQLEQKPARVPRPDDVLNKTWSTAA
jgi:transcriptional regulator with XRE-family HTH domain